ncbi:phospholipase A1-like [Chrysoperla carnea]|uniref:phospholipase A1-like n=1 Tax=Chrysoperla carnea TaxID=189513 RepID=UPI001D08B67B|nr:phospholipase A1-like [Chrysoperla carnea]
MKFFYVLFVISITISFLSAQEVETEDEDDDYNVDIDPADIGDIGNNTIYVLGDNGEVVMGQTNRSDPRQKKASAKNIHFYLYTKGGAGLDQHYELFVNKSTNLKNSPFNPAYPTKILIHGFGNSYKSPFGQQTKNSYLNSGRYNVIVVDWRKLARAPWYLTASKNTRLVGQTTAQLIDNLVQGAGMKLENLHIIGHSLGAHTAGIAGKNVKSGRVERITGLDPALPLYNLAPGDAEWRLTKDDAQFVDVIHTASGLLGFLFPLGDNDYYPNGGTVSQPGCNFDIGGSCSHSRSWEYFIETIPNAVAFPTRACENLKQVKDGSCDSFRSDAPNMGDRTFKDEENRIFYTKTRSEKPFAINVDV